jgi:hypothetical protein
MQEVLKVLQEKLHGEAAVSEALLGRHLRELVANPRAFELVLGCFPADPGRQVGRQCRSRKERRHHLNGT